MTGGVLFDMDGTLIESEPIWVEEEARIAAELGVDWSQADSEGTVGGSLDDFARQLIERGARIGHYELIETLSDRVTARVRVSTPWLPGAHELLAALVTEQIPAALVTNSMRRNAEPLLHDAPQGALRAAVTFDDVEFSKPHPEPYLTGAERLGIAPDQALVFEDSLNGATSARAAGMRIWFVETHTSAPAWVDRAVATLADVTVDEIRAALAAQSTRTGS